MLDEFHSFSDIIKNQHRKKAPAYPWQDLALRIVAELTVPPFKKSSIFKICKEYPLHIVETALNDTKELCPAGAKWKYFFKIIENIQNKDNDHKNN